MIGILGVMTAIAVVAYSRDVWIAGREGVHRRNAQALAALSGSASAAGATHVVPGDIIATIKNLSDGVTAERTGSDHPLIFRMKMDDDYTLQGAAFYLDENGEQLVYHGDRVRPD